jgi:hypothetical protein
MWLGQDVSTRVFFFSLKLTTKLGQYCFQIFCPSDNIRADSGGHAVSGLGLRPLASGISGFDSCRVHGCLSLTSVVCCTGTGLCDRPIPRIEKSHRVRMCLIVRSDAAITSTSTMSKYKEVKTRKKKRGGNILSRNPCLLRPHSITSN